MLRSYRWQAVVMGLMSLNVGAQDVVIDAAAQPDSQLPTIPVDERSTAEPEKPHRERRQSAIVDEVIVTAQKREEAVQDVPISISAFSGEKLEALGVTDPSKLNLVAPGLQMNESAGYTITFLRGVGTDAFLLADPSVATYIDEVYRPFSMAANKKFGITERVEVLKGPQGTLFGRNAVGGAISIVTKKPSLAGLAVNATAELGDYDARSAKVYANIPLLDDFAFAVTAFHDERDSYYNGVTGVSLSQPDGVPVPGENTDGFQVKLLYAPTDWSEFQFSYSRIEDSSGMSYAINEDPHPLFFFVPAQHGYNDTRTSLYPRLGGTDQVYIGSAKFQFGKFDVKLLGSRQEIHSYNTEDFDGSGWNLIDFDVRDMFSESTTAELQVLSNQNSWNSEKFSWIFGAYYFDSEQGVKPVYADVAGTDLVNGNVASIALPPEILALIPDPLASLIPLGGLLTFDGIVGTESLSGYFQTTYHFNDWFALTLGGRYQEEKRRVIDSRTYTLQADGSRGITLFDARDADPATYKNFGPKVTLEFRPADGTMIYASFQQAQKSGTFNVINLLDNKAEKVKAEDITAYEVGLKTDLFGNLVRLNSSAFYYDQRNSLVQFVSIFGGGIISFENAPKSRIYGLDYDLTIDVLPDILNGVYLTTSGAFIDAEYTSFHNCKGFGDVDGLYGEGNECTGNRGIRAPKFSGRVGLNKLFSFDESSVEIAGDYYHNSGYYTAATNTRRSHQKAYSVANAYAKYTYDPFRISITAFVNNVFDELYTHARLNTDVGNFVTYAPPRTYGIRFSWAYD